MPFRKGDRKALRCADAPNVIGPGSREDNEVLLQHARDCRVGTEPEKIVSPQHAQTDPISLGSPCSTEGIGQAL